MIGLTAFECYKTWSNRTFQAFLAILIAVNTLLLWFISDAWNSKYSVKSYNEIGVYLSQLSMDDRQNYLITQSNRIEALAVIDSIIQNEALNGGKINTSARKEYAEIFDEYEDLYRSKSYLLFCDSLSKEYRLIHKLAAECDVVYHYQTFLDSIEQKGQQLSNISIFSNNSTGYDLKNIRATVQAYQNMRDIVIDYFPQQGIFTALLSNEAIFENEKKNRRKGKSGSKDESNAFIYAIPPFKVSLSLPQGWHIVERASQSTSRLLAYSPLVSILDIYDSNGTLIGAVGYSTYEPFEGDSDSVPIVYSTIRLGANYSFSTDDAYEVVRTFSSGATATTNVIYRDGAASDEEINWGILAYDRTKLVFIAFEYDSAHTSREIVNEIAKTVEICE